jgi:ubiquinone/menaquinone biosynthesis C-methylase UbiE
MRREEVRSFFAERADRWEKRFPDDGPAFRQAIAEMALRPGQTVLDAGCGTGRAMPMLRAAVGPAGTVIGADFTAEMIYAAVRAGRRAYGALVVADVAALPLADESIDGAFASGLVGHLADPVGTLRELARVTRPWGRLGLFHPVGRATLAARHRKPMIADDVRAEPNLRPILAAAGWAMTSCDDSTERYLVLADRAVGGEEIPSANP